MEAAVAGVGKAVLNCLLSGAKAAIDEDVATKQVVQRDLPFLREELEAMHSFLVAADKDWNKYNVPNSKLKQVRDLSKDVEDCLEDFAVHSEKPSWWRLAHTRLERHRIAEEMKGLRARVEDMVQRNSRYHLGEDLMSFKPPTLIDAGQSSASAAPMPCLDEAKRTKDQAKVNLLRLITRRRKDELDVIAVWAATVDELRETSIIKMAYEAIKMQEKFNCTAWIRLMRPFDSTEFVQNIVNQFHVNFLQKADEREESNASLRKMGKMKGDDLTHEFKAYLEERSYLIVLNDLHTIEEWGYIRKYFPDNKKGSQILVSTEQVGVASLCVGSDDESPGYIQLCHAQNLYAFYNKDSKAGSSSNAETMIAAFEEIPATIANNKELACEEMTITAFMEFTLIGRWKEKYDIFKLISDEHGEQLEVISLWGMGGVGKTTLVRDIYQQENFNFEKHAYVTIMQPFNPLVLLKSLAEQFIDKNGDRNWTDLSSLLDGKKYLIVLDDLSSTMEWDSIVAYFPATRTASRILVTTRKENIARHCSNKRQNIFNLQSLCDKDAHDLFTRKVFKRICVNMVMDYPELVDPAKLLLSKCMGVPLAIVTIGGFLVHQPKTVQEWKKLNDHLSAKLEMDPKLGVIITSYDGLPYQLKCCFLYLSIFPRGHNISRKRLVRRWTIEGYSKESHNKSAEEIADNYFMKLIAKSMILPSWQSIDGRRVFDSCQVHDVLHDIAISKSMEENLVFRLEEGCSLSNQGIVRHLAISNNWKGDKSEYESIVDLSRIRSLTVFGKWRSFFISDKMRLLRVLDLEGKSNLVDHNLELIGKLLHLKYLFLRGCSGIYHLPDSLGDLWQLHTLDIRDTSIIKLPKSIIKLRKLKYLYAGKKPVNENTSFEEFVKETPKLKRHSRLCVLSMMFYMSCAASQSSFIDGMKRSRHDICSAYWCMLLPFAAMRLDMHGVVAPRRMSKLKALDTLGIVNIARGKTILQDIRMLTRLGKLAVTGINKRNSEEFFSAVANLSLLKSLSIRSEGCPGLADSLDCLSSPPENLQSLKLYGNLVKLPEWIQWLKNLVKLKLRNSRILEPDVVTRVLGNLPKLAILRLWEDSFKGEEICFTPLSGEFPSLMVLELDLVGNLKSVRFEQGAAPKLRELQFRACWPSNTKPGLFRGLDCLGNLNTFMLENDSYNKDFMDGLLAELAMNPNQPVLRRY